TDRDISGTLISTPLGDKGKYLAYYDRLFKELNFNGYVTKTPERVFISRKGTRSLLNEKEIEAVLQDYGFQKVYYEDISVSEQWSISKNAKVVVGIHGAALCSLLFNRNAVKLVELFHPGYVTHLYRNIVCVLGGSWCGVTGEMETNLIKELDVRKNSRRFALSPTKIDPTSLRKALQHLGIE
ncbi:MAG: glycosyltransferase family 61 protein, partial [Geitlerinemataceae cyanobacterium]